MSLHPSREVLEQFALGDLGEHVAVYIASHLDDCPQCAAAARALDPLTAAFTATPHAPVPDRLAAHILEQHHQRPVEARIERTIGLGLLALSLLLALTQLHLEVTALSTLSLVTAILEAASLVATADVLVATMTLVAAAGFAGWVVLPPALRD